LWHCIGDQCFELTSGPGAIAEADGRAKNLAFVPAGHAESRPEHGSNRGRAGRADPTLSGASDAIAAANCAGEVPIGTMSSSSKRSRTSGSARMRTASRWSLAMIGSGVPAGASSAKIANSPAAVLNSTR
jgi:hypothetical protein